MRLPVLHGFYVWLCYGLVLGALLAYYWYSKRLASVVQNNLAKFYRRMDARQKGLQENSDSNLESNVASNAEPNKKNSSKE